MNLNALYRSARHVGELLVIAGLLAGTLLWTAPMGKFAGADDAGILSYLLENNIRAVVSYTVVLIVGLLLFTRLIAKPALFLTAAVLWTVFVFGHCIHMTGMPHLRVFQKQVLEIPGSSLLMPELLIPGTPLDLLRYFLVLVVSFLSGLYVCGTRWTWWKFLLGSYVAGIVLLTVVAPLPVITRFSLPIQPLLFGLLGLVLFYLPLQRVALERLTGVRFTAAGDAPAGGETKPGFGRFGGHEVLLVLLIACGVSFWIFQIEKKQADLIKNGPTPYYRSAAERNAYPVLRSRFLKPERGASTDTLPRAFDVITELFQNDLTTTTIVLDAGKHARLAEALGSIEDHLDTFEDASEADYLELPRGAGLPYYRPIRETARALALRSITAAQDGNSTAALEDIRTLNGFGNMMKDYPVLVVQMTAAAVRGMAVESAYRYYWCLREDAGAMRSLLDYLQASPEHTRVKLDLDALRRGEAGLLPIVPRWEMVAPAFLRADINTRMTWLQFQQMEIAVALEVFRHETGDYPAGLDELSPRYLRRVPVDPFEGREYRYKRTAVGFESGPDFKAFDPRGANRQALSFGQAD